MVVGAPFESDVGTAYLYDLSSAAPPVPALTLNNPSPITDDRFGISVAISGPRIVIGAYQDDTGAANAGSVYVYDLDGATPTVPVVTLNNPSPTAGDNFGSVVAISGTRVVVATPSDDTGAGNAGTVYVYDLNSAAPTVPVVTLNNPSPALNDFFGSVAISGTRLVVGVTADDTGAPDAGSAYVYDLNSATPTVPVATLNNPTPAASDRFGAVAIDGTRVVVGAWTDDTGATDGRCTTPIRQCVTTSADRWRSMARPSQSVHTSTTPRWSTKAPPLSSVPRVTRSGKPLRLAINSHPISAIPTAMDSATSVNMDCCVLPPRPKVRR